MEETDVLKINGDDDDDVLNWMMNQNSNLLINSAILFLAICNVQERSRGSF